MSHFAPPGKMKRIPKIVGMMTPFPYSIAIDAALSEAHRMMQDHEIRHLPVTDEGLLAGVLSERDVLVAEAGAADPQSLQVRDVYQARPYVVETTEQLDNVVMEMAERDLGAALVVKEGKLAGIITNSDVCRLLAELLRTWFPPPGNGDHDAGAATKR